VSRRWLRRLIAGTLVALVIALALGAGYFAIPQPELPEAAAALASTNDVDYALEGDRLTFRPKLGSPDTGLIVYPGGKVSAAAYAPLAQAIASHGYLVEIVPMPLNLAVLGIDRARGVIEAHPEITHWAIGGHSLGGAMAAQYAAGDDRIQALALWASYSATDLSGRDLAVLVVYGSLDAGAAGFLSPERLANLPPDPTIVVIDGGNHEQMGWYTGQPNDPPATISRTAQQARVIDATVSLLAGLGGAGATGSIGP
jgi:pimeloyl-ACP methyl ester carboxylesterase